MAWWRGRGEQNVFPAYRAHLANIRHLLPERLIWLQEYGRLHDAKVQRTAYDSAASIFEIELIACDEPDDCENACEVKLRYSQIVLIRSTVDPEGALPGPIGYGDLGYDEVDVTADGHFEHRLLFSTGIEIQIIFAEFKLKWTVA